VNRPAGECTALPYRGLSPETTAFDVDGVIADTMRLFIDIARESFQINNLRHEDITTYHLDECLDLAPDTIEAIIRQILDGSHGLHLHAIAGCRRAMARFAGNGQAVRFVTARPGADVIRPWLESTLPLRPDQIEVVATGSFEAKADVLHAEGIRVFVEDRLETCFLLSQTGITPILFIQPWNRFPHPFREVASWEELAALMAP
jgi:5'(3')-deoxyribonucleotidase